MLDLSRIPGYVPGRPPQPLFDIDYLSELEATWGRPWGAQSELGTLKAVLTYPPGEECAHPSFLQDIHFFRVHKGLPNLERLKLEYRELVSVLKGEGVEVIELDPPRPVTGTYGIPLRRLMGIRGTAVVIKGGAIVSRDALAEARGREVYVTRKLAEIGCPILYTVHGHGVYEGGGNTIWLDSRHVCIGLGLRGNQDGIEQIAPVLRRAGVEEIHVVPLPGYMGYTEWAVGGSAGVSHLDMALGLADRDLAVVYPGGLDYNTILYLRGKGFRLIEAPEPEVRNAACNLLALRPGKVIIPAGNPVTVRALRENGVEVIEVDMTETNGAGVAGPACVTLPLIREEGRALPA